MLGVSRPMLGLPPPSVSLFRMLNYHQLVESIFLFKCFDTAGWTWGADTMSVQQKLTQ